MTIISLDCASKTGWAIIRDGKIHESGDLDPDNVKEPDHASKMSSL